jgi:hypothetical protein
LKYKKNIPSSSVATVSSVIALSYLSHGARTHQHDATRL